MWIERLDFAGFGNLSGEKIEFKNGKLNLIVEPSQFGKSTIADALWAIIFDFPRGQNFERTMFSLRELRRPAKAQSPYFACVDVATGSRSLKVIRDFNDGSVQVVDRQRNNHDVTADFFTAQGAEEIGLRLTEISRELYQSTFFVGQRQLYENKLSGNEELLSIFQKSAESSSSASSALPVLNEALNDFSYGGNKGKLDTIIRNLEARQNELKVRMAGFEGQRKDVSAQLLLMIKIKHQQKNQHEHNVLDETVNEYYELRRQAAELDQRLAVARASSDLDGPKRELQLEVLRLSHLQDFPVEMADQLNTLWSKRQTRLDDYRKAEERLAPILGDFEQQVESLQERLPGLQKFTMEDAQNLTVLANALQHVQNEVSELTQRRQSEASRVRSTNSVDLERVEQMRKSLHPLEPREVDSARTYDALINAARTQLVDCHRLIGEANAVIAEIEDEKKGKKGSFFNSAHKKREGEIAAEQIHQQQDLIQQLQNKISSLDSRLETLAKKAGLSGSTELLKHVNEYSSKSVAVRDIEAIDQVLSTRESILAKGKQDLRPYFEKAGRSADAAINGETARALASDVARFIDETRRIDASFVPALQARQELEQISTDINDTEGLIESMFMRSNLPEPSNLISSYEEFRTNISLREKLLQIKAQLVAMEKGHVSSELESAAQLSEQREDLLSRIQELVEQFPDVVDMNPSSGSGRPALSDRSELEFELDQKAEFIRAAMHSFDAGYLETIRDLDRVDYDLTHLRQARAAIELSRETLQRLSNESSFDIMSELNGIANNLSAQMGFDFASVEFGADLKLSVRLNGPSHVNHINIDQLSASEKAKAHLLARLSVCQLLASKTRLPFVLDEVLSEFDDETFLRVMKFLFDIVAQGNQVIMFSNQRLRYEWLMQNLTEEQKQLIAICRKSLLRADPVAS